MNCEALGLVALFIVLTDLPPTGVVTRFRVVSVLGFLVCASHKRVDR